MVTYPTTVDYNKMFLTQFALIKEQMVAESELSLYSEAAATFSCGYNPELLMEAKGDRQAFFKTLLQRIRQIWTMFLTNIEQLFATNVKWVKDNQDAITGADFEKVIGADGYEMYPYFKAATLLNRNQVPKFNKNDKNLLSALVSAETFRDKYFGDFVISNVPFNEGVKMKLRGVTNYRNPENDKKLTSSTIKSNIQNMVTATLDYKSTQSGLNTIHKEIESTANEAIAEIRKQATTVTNETFFHRLEGKVLSEVEHVDYVAMYEYLQYTFQSDLFGMLDESYFEDCNLIDAKRKIFNVCESITNGEFNKARDMLYGFRNSVGYLLSEDVSQRSDFNGTLSDMFNRLELLESFYEDKEYQYVRDLREGAGDNPEAGANASTSQQDVASQSNDQKKEDAKTLEVQKQIDNDENGVLIKSYELYIKEAQSFCSIKMSIFEEKNKAYMRLFKTLVGESAGTSDKAKGEDVKKDQPKDIEQELQEVKDKISELQALSTRTVTQEGELAIARRRRKELEKKMK